MKNKVGDFARDSQSLVGERVITINVKKKNKI
jgi:hypothetical protein